MIRAATMDDIPAVLPLARGLYAAGTVTYCGHRCDGDPGGWDEGNAVRYLRNVIGSDNMACLVAESAHGLFGFIIAIITPIHDDPRATFCQEVAIWTSPEFMGVGAGADLIEAMCKFAKSKGCEMVMLGTNRSMNPQAVGDLYCSLGFAEIGRLYAKGI